MIRKFNLSIQVDEKTTVTNNNSIVNNNKVTTKHVFQGGFIVGIIYFAKVVYPLLSLNAWWCLILPGLFMTIS